MCEKPYIWKIQNGELVKEFQNNGNNTDGLIPPKKIGVLRSEGQGLLASPDPAPHTHQSNLRRFK